MKHMKRALSLVLAMVMLLGMMVIPTGAVSNFTDEAEITYDEAVQVTSGLGLFAGSNGQFQPKGTVTRAQMATIIVKMLHGSEANADAFKGIAGGFTDTASFEGGWAEGYINWCASLGVVAGYGDGTFRPGQAVTTAEAVTMILNALKIDAGAGQWPLTVMSKAEQLKFLKDLSPKPDSNKALTREELAVVAFAGLEYSPEGKTEYVYNGNAYDDYLAAYLAAGRDATKVEAVKTGSLSAEVFKLKSVTGFVTGNQATGLEYTEVEAVVDGVLTATPYQFSIETDKDAIGHYVTVYYDEQYKANDPGKTYSIFDEGTVVAVAEDIDSRAKFRAAFGSASVKVGEVGCVVEDDYTAVVVDADFADQITFVTGDTYDVPAGTYILDSNAVVAYIAPAAVYAAKIDDIVSYEGEESIALSGVLDEISNSEDNDMIDEYLSAKAGDYVTYTKVGDRYVLERMTKISGKVTAKSKTEINGVDYDVISVNGKEYVAFGGTNDTGLSAAVSGLNYDNLYDFYITVDGKFAGYEASSGSLDLADVVYLLGVIETTEEDSYGEKVIKYTARGVTMGGEETLVPLAQVKDANKNGTYDDGEEILGDADVAADPAVIGENFYKVKDHSDSKARKVGIRALEGFEEQTEADGRYNPDADDVFTSKYMNGSVGMKYAGQGTFPCGYVYIQATSRVLLMDGKLNQATPLQPMVRTGSYSVVLDETYSTRKPVALISKVDGGGLVIEAVVIPVKSADAVGAEQKIYVSKEKASYVSNTANGYVFEVYEATTGALTEITLASNDPAIHPTKLTLTPGFYRVALDSDTKQHYFVSGTYNVNGYIPAVCAISAETQEVDTTLDRADGVPGGQHVLYGKTFTNLYNNRMVLDGGSYIHMDVSSAVVVDVRTEKKIEASHIGRVTSADRIASLQNGNEDLVINMDMWVGANPWKVNTIYITDIYDKDDVTVEEIADLNSMAGIDIIEFTAGIYTDYADEDWLAEHIADEQLIVTAKRTTIAGEVTVEIQNVYYQVPNGVVLYSVNGFAKSGKTIELAVVDNAGTSLVVGETYLFSGYDETKIWTASAGGYNMYFYGYNPAGVTKAQLVIMAVPGATPDAWGKWLNGGGALADNDLSNDFTTTRADGLFAKCMSYHKVVTAFDAETGALTVTTARCTGLNNTGGQLYNPDGSAMQNKHSAQFNNCVRSDSNRTTDLKIVDDTIIIDSRNGSAKALTVQEFAALVESGTVTVDAVAKTSSGSDLKYVVVTAIPVY